MGAQGPHSVTGFELGSCVCKASALTLSSLSGWLGQGFFPGSFGMCVRPLGSWHPKRPEIRAPGGQVGRQGPRHSCLCDPLGPILALWSCCAPEGEKCVPGTKRPLHPLQAGSSLTDAGSTLGPSSTTFETVPCPYLRAAGRSRSCWQKPSTTWCRAWWKSARQRCK